MIKNKSIKNKANDCGEDVKNILPQNVNDVFNFYRERLTGFIKKRVRRLEDAEDILQEVFYQFSRVNSLAQPVEQTAAWLYRVARNMIINHRNKKSAVQFPVFYDDDDDDEFVFQDIADLVFDKAATPETEFLRKIVLDEVQIALSELPKEQRAVFEMTEYFGLSVKEVAKQTNTALNTVLSRKHYAVLHLRKRLKTLYTDLAM
ncbi:MAG: RNA polymerase sigma factor [Spirochaetaceae bacterium]|nr:RNA polymerase sigma factor [Spirochaetaceae bacterium]